VSVTQVSVSETGTALGRSTTLARNPPVILCLFQVAKAIRFILSSFTNHNKTDSIYLNFDHERTKIFLFCSI